VIIFRKENTMNQTLLPNAQKIALIQANWHADIVEQASKSFIKNMAPAGITEKDIEVIDVPGSLEIPLMAKRLAETGRYAIIVATGFIINGGIYHHEYVNHAVLDGMMRAQLDTNVPVLSVVLTPHNYHGSEAERKFFLDHFVIKGEEAADACIKTLENMSRFTVLSEAA
jgi:6,7-dimethyl-8-ribityllumazine synthase